MSYIHLHETEKYANMEDSCRDSHIWQVQANMPNQLECHNSTPCMPWDNTFILLCIADKMACDLEPHCSDYNQK